MLIDKKLINLLLYTVKLKGLLKHMRLKSIYFTANNLSIIARYILSI